MNKCLSIYTFKTKNLCINTNHRMSENKPKKSRKRYTLIDENSIEILNQKFYQGQEMKELYIKYFTDNNVTPEKLYHGRYKTHKSIYESLPPEVRRIYHRFFDLECDVIKSRDYKIVVKRIK